MKIGNYPEIVNENAVRWIAGFTAILALFSVLFPETYLILPLMLGFIARFLYGPKYSPTALIVTRWIIPKLNISFKPAFGSAKRFAQSIGIIFCLTSGIFLFMENIQLYQILMGVLIFFASLEAIFGFCAGCFVFGYLIQWGVLPQEVCEKCSNINYEI
jgi:hypothetical protein